MTDRIRVLVVDDSAFARRVIRQILERAGGIEVVDVARDGVEALEKIANLRPDVVTLDLMMPGLDGVAVLQALPDPNGPRVIVVSASGVDTDLGAAALAAGAIDLVEKPTTQATDRLLEMSEELVDRVRLAASARATYVRAPIRAAPSAPASQPRSTTLELVLVGASTGGPQALTRLLPALPADLSVPVVVVIHMPPGYVESLARRLDALCTLHVLEGHDRLALTPGMVVIAPAGAHFRFARESTGLFGILDYTRSAGELHHPSVDVMFTSAAEVCGSRALGVVLTGMGRDGVIGARALVDAGSKVITEDESTCVVYGMPRSIVEAGLADATEPIDGLAGLITARV